VFTSHQKEKSWIKAEYKGRQGAGVELYGVNENGGTGKTRNKLGNRSKGGSGGEKNGNSEQSIVRAWVGASLRRTGGVMESDGGKITTMFRGGVLMILMLGSAMRTVGVG